MLPDFDACLAEMRAVFVLIENSVPAPVQASRGDDFVFRCQERTLEQALVMKLARAVSDLGAAMVLLEHGYVQEVGTLQRCIDDFNEEIKFLALARLTDTETEVHQRFLDGFYSEVIDDLDDVVGSLTKKRPGVNRREIREATEVSLAEMSRRSGTDLQPGSELNRAISTLYNSFAHAGSPQVLEMYGGNPPRFHLNGMLGTRRIAEHRRDIVNQFYRTSATIGLVALATGNGEAFARAKALSTSLQPYACSS